MIGQSTHSDNINVCFVVENAKVEVITYNENPADWLFKKKTERAEGKRQKDGGIHWWRRNVLFEFHADEMSQDCEDPRFNNKTHKSVKPLSPLRDSFVEVEGGRWALWSLILATKSKFFGKLIVEELCFLKFPLNIRPYTFPENYHVQENKRTSDVY